MILGMGLDQWLLGADGLGDRSVGGILIPRYLRTENPSPKDNRRTSDNSLHVCHRK